MSYPVIVFATLVAVILPVRAWHRGRHKCPPAPTIQYLFESATLSCLLLLLLRREGVPPSVVGLRLTAFPLFAFHATMGVIAVIAPDIVAMLLRRLSPGMIQYMPADDFGSILRGKALFTFIPVCIVGAFWEELCFRGVGMYAAPPGQIGTVIAIVVSSLIFGLHHLRGGFQSVIFTSYCGVIFCTLYLVTRDLPSVMVAHALGNLAVGFYFAPKARSQRRPLPSFF